VHLHDAGLYPFKSREEPADLSVGARGDRGGGLLVVTLHALARRRLISVLTAGPCQVGGAEPVKAVVYDTYGPPDVLRLEEVARPIADSGRVNRSSAV
jgi:hypothetical protein